MRGFKGQGMDGRKASLYDPFPIKLTVDPSYPGTGVGSWVVPTSGSYLFALHGNGGGGLGSLPGGPGGLAIKTVNLRAGQIVSYVVGGQTAGGSGNDCTVTFPDGSVMKVTPGGQASVSPAPGVGGVATGGDININGVSGSFSAASYGGITGGVGGSGYSGVTAGAPGSNNTGPEGGAGRLLVVLLGTAAGAKDTP